MEKIEQRLRQVETQLEVLSSSILVRQGYDDDLKERVETLIEAINHDLQGNGNPGIKHRLRVVEEKIAGFARVLWVVIPAGALAVAKLVWAELKR